MLTNVKAAIFDLDGTLVDSMWVWEQIDKDYLSSINVSIPSNLKDEINHLSFRQTAIYFKNKFNLNDSINDIMETWSSMAYKHYANNVSLKPGAIDFLNFLKDKKIKIGLATSNSRPLLEVVLKNNGIYDFFDSITTTDETSRNKSHPDVYLLAAKKLDINPRSCIVFEDIIEAVYGAKKASMKVIGVYDQSAEYQRDILTKECDLYIESFYELI